MIQVKNRNDATTVKSIFQEEFTTVSKKRKAPDVQAKRKREEAPNPPTDPPTDQPTSHKASIRKASIRNGSNFVLNKMTNPILFLLFDLGITITNRRVEVSYGGQRRKFSTCVGYPFERT